MLHFKEGQVIYERFQLGTCLGNGGFGQVWQAQDLKLERIVAIKRLQTEGAPL